MDGAVGRDVNIGEPPDQALPDFAGAPTGVFALHVQDKVLHLKGKLMSIAIRTAASIGQPLNAALLVAVEYFVTGLARDAEL